MHSLINGGSSTGKTPFFLDFQSRHREEFLFHCYQITKSEKYAVNKKFEINEIWPNYAKNSEQQIFGQHHCIRYREALKKHHKIGKQSCYPGLQER